MQPILYDDDLMMEVASDDESTPMPGSFHVGLVMQQVHFKAILEKDQHKPLSMLETMSVFRQAQEEKRSNLDLLAHH
mgnify:CR=1 FL=1